MKVWITRDNFQTGLQQVKLWKKCYNPQLDELYNFFTCDNYIPDATMTLDVLFIMTGGKVKPPEIGKRILVDIATGKVFGNGDKE